MTRRQLTGTGDYATTLELPLPLADEGNRAASARTLARFSPMVRATMPRRNAGSRMAADQGLAESQFNMGVLYQNGRGVPQDYQPVRDLVSECGRSRSRPCPAQPRTPCTPMAKACRATSVEAYKWLNLAAASLRRRSPRRANWRSTAATRIAAWMTPAQVAEAREPRQGLEAGVTRRNCHIAMTASLNSVVVVGDAVRHLRRRRPQARIRRIRTSM